ncbi:MAG: helix-turn-helix domain-containing protein [Nocardioidaceae bacterium]|nr:helix-turn-helix domain-containing protein [Nocardioidaceae bacterium]
MSDWDQIADLIERVVAAPDLIDEVVEEVRASIREVAGLDASDVAGHTRALLAAATRSIASRRGPTEAELSFVEDLAVTRARQGVPIHAVLSAIHVAERRIWARAKVVAARSGVDPGLVLDARELYDDWAQEVRGRLLRAHRSAEASHGAGDKDADAVRRLLEGGSVASLAAAAAGLPATGLHVLVSPHPDRAGVASAVRRAGVGVVADTPAETVAVVRRVPAGLRSGAGPVGLAGPGTPEEVGNLRRHAAAAARAAQARGRSGCVDVAEVATLTAQQDRGDLAALLVERHAPAVDGLGRLAGHTVATVRAWLECGCDAQRTAEREFVHPNTVRNRVNTLTGVTGLDPRDPFEAVDLWWLCVSWQERRT